MRVLGVLLLCLTSLATACSQDPAIPKVMPIIPLGVGSSWHYNGIIDSVLRVTRVDDIEYAVFLGPSFVGWEPTALRYSGSNQLLIRDEKGEQLLFDFGAPVGASWIFNNGPIKYLITVESRNLQNVVVPAGSFSDCFFFSMSASGSDLDWNFIIAPEVGVVIKSGGFGFSYKLQEYSVFP